VSQEWLTARTDAPLRFSPLDVVCAAFQLSWGRPVWTWQTLVCLLLLGLAAGLVVAHRWLSGDWEVDDFVSEILMGSYIGFLLPVWCLCFGSQLIGGAWEEGWLLWLLLRPVPRSLVYTLLLVAALPWILALSLGGAWLLGALAGTQAFHASLRLAPALALGTLAYTTLFVFLSVWLRRATLISIAYVFVVENVISYMPGWMSRGSISCYIRSLVISAGLTSPESNSLFSFVPVSRTAAWITLAVITFAFAVAGGMIFSRREYGQAAV